MIFLIILLFFKCFFSHLFCADLSKYNYVLPYDLEKSTEQIIKSIGKTKDQVRLMTKIQQLYKFNDLTLMAKTTHPVLDQITAIQYLQFQSEYLKNMDLLNVSKQNITIISNKVPTKIAFLYQKYAVYNELFENNYNIVDYKTSLKNIIFDANIVFFDEFEFHEIYDNFFQLNDIKKEFIYNIKTNFTCHMICSVLNAYDKVNIRCIDKEDILTSPIQNGILCLGSFDNTWRSNQDAENPFDMYFFGYNLNNFPSFLQRFLDNDSDNVAVISLGNNNLDLSNINYFQKIKNIATFLMTLDSKGCPYYERVIFTSSMDVDGKSIYDKSNVFSDEDGSHINNNVKYFDTESKAYLDILKSRTLFAPSHTISFCISNNQNNKMADQLISVQNNDFSTGFVAGILAYLKDLNPNFAEQTLPVSYYSIYGLTNKNLMQILLDSSDKVQFSVLKYCVDNDQANIYQTKMKSLVNFSNVNASIINVEKAIGNYLTFFLKKTFPYFSLFLHSFYNIKFELDNYFLKFYKNYLIDQNDNIHTLNNYLYVLTQHQIYGKRFSMLIMPENNFKESKNNIDYFSFNNPVIYKIQFKQACFLSANLFVVTDLRYNNELVLNKDYRFGITYDEQFLTAYLSIEFIGRTSNSFFNCKLTYKPYSYKTDNTVDFSKISLQNYSYFRNINIPSQTFNNLTNLKPAILSLEDISKTFMRMYT